MRGRFSHLTSLLMMILIVSVITSCQQEGNLSSLLTMANMPTEHQLLFSPSSFSHTGLKTVASTSQILTLNTYGKVPSASCSSPTITGTDAASFSIVSETCTNTWLSNAINCQVEIQGTPSSASSYSATLEVACGDKTASAPLSMTGENFSVVSITPANGAVNVDANEKINITFSHNLDSTTAIPGILNIKESIGHAVIPYSASYNSSTYTLTLTPLRTVSASKKVTIKLKTTLVSASGAVGLNDTTLYEYTTSPIQVWGHGYKNTLATPDIYGGCSRNVSSITATLNGSSIALIDSDCSDGTWSAAPNLSTLDLDYTLAVTVSDGTYSSTKYMTLKRCSSMAAITADSSYASGSGVNNDPYMITSIEELAGMASNLTAYYKLSNNLDLGCKLWTPIGTSGTPFTGTLLGNFKSIDNFSLTAAAQYQGLFGSASGATIQGLTLTNIYVNGGGNTMTGGLAGNVENSAKVQLNYVSGHLTNGTQQGALMGRLYESSLVQDNIVEAAVTSPSSSSVGAGIGIATCSAYPLTNFIYRNVITTTLQFGAINSYGGFIGYASNNAIKWNRVEGEIYGSAAGGMIGGMIGNTNSLHYVDDNQVLANINSTGTAGYIGGFSGRCFACTRILGNYVKGIVSAAAGSSIGGFFGFVDSTSILPDNMVEATVTGNNAVGGLAGNIFDANSRMHRSLFIGTVTGNTNVHALAGLANAAQNSTNNFKLTFRDDACASGTGCASGLGKSYNTANLKLRATFEDSLYNWFLDKGHTWWISEGNDYPRLWRQSCLNRWESIDASSGFSGGNGTPSDPYQITTHRQLPLMANDLSASYLLMNDLNLSDKCLKMGVKIGDNITPFTGTFNGQNYTIDGLNAAQLNDYTAFFGYTSGATIQNLKVHGYLQRLAISGYGSLLIGRADNTTLSNLTVTGRIETFVNETAKDFTALVVGYADGTTTLSNITVGGSIQALTEYDGLIAGYIAGSISNATAVGHVIGSNFTGGIAGHSDGAITDCDVNAAITPYNNYHYHGGVAGIKNSGAVARCSTRGKINATGTSNYVGGLVAYLQNTTSSITDSYSSMVAIGNDYVGGLVGRMLTGTPTLTNLYATGPVTATLTNVGQGVGLKSNGTITKVYTKDQNADCATPFDSSTNTGGCAETSGAVEISDAELRATTTFTGAGVNWDTVTIWNVVNGFYPLLR